jgi:hypothetical protein
MCSSTQSVCGWDSKYTANDAIRLHSCHSLHSNCTLQRRRTLLQLKTDCTLVTQPAACVRTYVHANQVHISNSINTYTHYTTLQQGDRRCGHAGAAGSESGSFCYTAFNLDTPYGLEALKIMYKVILDETVKSPIDLPPIPGTHIQIVHLLCHYAQ